MLSDNRVRVWLHDGWRRGRGPGSRSPAWRSGTVVLLTILLGGCAWLQARSLSPVPPERTHIIVRLSAPLAIAGGERYEGPDQRQDYLLMRGAAGQAELIYVDALGYRAALRYRGGRLRQLSEGWNINAGGIRDWGTAHTLDTPLARFHYVPYTTRSRECAAFQALWAVPPGDVERRPGKLIFGYYCAAPHTPLDEITLDRFLAALRLGFYPASSHPAPIPRLHAQTDKADTGYHPFPRLLSVFLPPMTNGQGSSSYMP